MNKFLKGNYTSPKLAAQKVSRRTKKRTRSEATTETFERKAVERLGGSIAFVLKSKTLVWDGPQGAKNGK